MPSSIHKSFESSIFLAVQAGKTNKRKLKKKKIREIVEVMHVSIHWVFSVQLILFMHIFAELFINALSNSKWKTRENKSYYRLKEAVPKQYQIWTYVILLLCTIHTNLSVFSNTGLVVLVGWSFMIVCSCAFSFL